MSRTDGFGICDLDSGLMADPKIVALARRLRDPIRTAAAVSLYVALVTGSWGAGKRISITDALPAWWLADVDDLVSELQAAGLVDDRQSIPEHAWSSWFLPAWERREVRREKAAKGGRSRRTKDPNDAWSQPTDDSEHASSEPVRSVSSSPSRQTDPRANAREESLT